MKKLLIIFFMLCFISCTPILKGHDMTTLASTATIRLPATAIALSEETAIQHPTAIATIKPSVTFTTLPELTVTQPVFKVIQKEYNPSEWKVLYDKHSVRQIELGSKEQMWIIAGSQVGYFDGENWILFNEKDYGLPDAFDMAVAPDGTLWIASPQAISKYHNGIWYVYSVPDSPEWSYPFLAVDSYNVVWLSLWLCYCENSLRTFNGTNWDTQRQQLHTYQLIFTPDGSLWTSSHGSIGQYNGKTWKIYSVTELWPKSSDHGIRIASDSQGNIFGIQYSQKWIVKINLDRSISKIPFDFMHYGFIAERMRIFIDNQGRIWTNACQEDQNGLDYQNCFTYYQDNQWISYNDLPFWSMIDMKELSDGTLLVATDKGLFQYKPSN